jgi:hypothetical protein
MIYYLMIILTKTHCSVGPKQNAWSIRPPALIDVSGQSEHCALSNQHTRRLYRYIIIVSSISIYFIWLKARTGTGMLKFCFCFSEVTASLRLLVSCLLLSP